MKLTLVAARNRFRPIGAESGTLSSEPPGDVARHEIESSIKRGAVWTFGSQIGVQVVRAVGIAVLARLLTPDDYGAAALAVTIGAYSVALGDLGYGTAFVQAKVANQAWASTTFWSGLAAGSVLFLTVGLLAVPAARVLAHGDDVASLVAATGFTFVLVALGSTSLAILTRSMSFGVIQSSALVGFSLATGCGIAAASLGAGPWSLVLQQLTLPLVTSCLLIVAGRWRPSFTFSRPAFRSLSAFAFPFTGAAAFGIFQTVLTVLLIGRLQGLDDLGVWNLSLAVVIVPLSLMCYPLSRVIYAAFARMRDSQERVAELWLKGFTVFAAVMFPAVFGLIAIAPDVVPLLFGPQWTQAVPIVQILCSLVMIRALQTWNEPVMDAAGKPHVATILTGVGCVVLLPSIWLGSAFGLEGIAVAYCAALLLFGEVPSFLFTTRELSLKPLHVLGRVWGVVLSAVTVCALVAFARRALEEGGVPVGPRVVLSVILGVIVYVSLLTLTARGVALELLQLARKFVGRRSRNAESVEDPPVDPHQMQLNPAADDVTTRHLTGPNLTGSSSISHNIQ